MGVERRLQIISQEILSRSRLGQLVEQFKLYQDLNKQKAPEDTIAAAMRRDIGIQITGRGSGIGNDTVVFEVSYTNQDPQTVMQVANTLASFYIEENLKVREAQALGTSEFLRAELEEVKKQLEAQEQQVVEYKTRHMGELPEQLNANLSTLSVLQKQLEIVSDNLTRARERRNVLMQMGEMDAALTSLGPSTSLGAGDARLGTLSLGTLKRQLAELKLRFSDKHPDVIRLKQQISALEAEAKNQAQPEITQPTDTSLSLAVPKRSSAQIEQATADAEIKGLNDDLVKVQRDISVYKQRIENTPQRDQELTSISRDYNATRELYVSLLKRLDEAKLSDSLEERQKAERFRLLEPAVYPKEPVGPNRVKFFFMGFALGLGAAMAGVLLWEFLDSSFHRVEDLKTFTTVRILGTVPQIITKADSLQKGLRLCFGTVTLVVVLLALVGIAYRVSSGNDQLVRLLVKPTSGLPLR